jgi:hypothetical protein
MSEQSRRPGERPTRCGRGGRRLGGWPTSWWAALALGVALAVGAAALVDDNPAGSRVALLAGACVVAAIVRVLDGRLVAKAGLPTSVCALTNLVVTLPVAATGAVVLLLPVEVAGAVVLPLPRPDAAVAGIAAGVLFALPQAVYFALVRSEGPSRLEVGLRLGTAPVAALGVLLFGGAVPALDWVSCVLLTASGVLMLGGAATSGWPPARGFAAAAAVATATGTSSLLLASTVEDPACSVVGAVWAFNTGASAVLLGLLARSRRVTRETGWCWCRVCWGLWAELGLRHAVQLAVGVAVVLALSAGVSVPIVIALSAARSALVWILERLANDRPPAVGHRRSLLALACLVSGLVVGGLSGRAEEEVAGM